MNKIRTLVIDDEPLARRRIVKLLEQFEEVELIAECKNGQEALKGIQNYQPDLVFLDIQMPDFNGFDVLNKLEGHPIPFIIFVTAFDQYALQAFDVHAVDYLLKPYDNERFAHAVKHAKEYIRLKQESVLHHKVMRLIDAHRHTGDTLQVLEIKDKGSTQHINVYDVYYLESHGNYVKIHTEKRSHLLRHTLQQMEEKLDADLFLRIHRSLLLNTNYISKTAYQGNGQYRFRLKNGLELFSSRGYKETIHDYLADLG